MLGPAVDKPKALGCAWIRPLLELCVRGLEPMLHVERNLFSYKVKRTAQGLLKEGVSPRYTAIVLLGLQRAERAGLRPAFDTRRIFERLTRETQWIDSAGDWGLQLWLAALREPAELRRLTLRAGLDTLLERFPDMRERRTMEMAWLLAGLAHMRLAGFAGSPDASPVAFEIYRWLLQNQGAEGIFGHQAPGKSYAGRFRGRLGSFADQAYPIYALAKFGEAWSVGEAIRRARKCADAICRLQGAMGQWWWHYDSASGRVVGRYPVYSVHQDGMAPMALFALSQTSGADYDEPLRKGLEWICGENELGVDLRDSSANMVWRCIHQSKLRKYSTELLCLAGMPPVPRGLKVLHECRPYHLGWVLYSLS